MKTSADRTEVVDLFETLEKISRAAKEHDEGKGVPVGAFFREFEKKYSLKSNSAKS